MKAFVAIFVLAAVSAHPEFQSRITGGSDAKANTIKSFVAIQVEFESGSKTCGGVLGTPEDKIITSASCVMSASEGTANSLKFAFGQSNDFSRNKIGFTDIYPMSTYDPTKNTSADDLAVIMLEDRVKTSSSILGAVPSTDDKPDAFLGESLVVCGFGVIDNNRNKTKTLKCTKLKVVAGAECVKATGAAAAPPAATPPAARRKRSPQDPPAAPAAPAAGAAPKGMICTKNTDDKNACSGDIGSPAYSNKTGSLVAVGVVSYFPDTRPNARCQDGHHVVITQLGSYVAFLNNPSAPPAAAPPAAAPPAAK